MRARRILIVFGTTYGQTARIARRMAERFRSLGVDVTLANADLLPPGLLLRDFDGVIVGSSVLYDRYHRGVVRFVREQRDALNAMPSAFFSVSGCAGSTAVKERVSARLLIEELERATGWHCTMSEAVAGAIPYSRYRPWMRWVMRRIAARRGWADGGAREVERTDWAQVARFVDAFSAEVPMPTAPTPALVHG